MYAAWASSWGGEMRQWEKEVRRGMGVRHGAERERERALKETDDGIGG